MLQHVSRPASAAQRGARGIVRARRVCVRGVGVLALLLGLGGGVGGTSAVAALPEALPDGRVYEQASAVKKNGNEAGVGLVKNGSTTSASGSYGTAAPDGGAVAYWQEGPAGETKSGADLVSVSRRNPQGGWEASAALPPEDVGNGDYLGALPKALLPSADLSRFLFIALGPFVKENSVSLGSSKGDENLGLYRTNGNSSEPDWLTRPTNFEKLEGEVTEKSAIVKGLSSTANIIARNGVTGAKIKPGTTARVINGHEVELSAAIEGSGGATVKEMLTFSEAKPEPGKMEGAVEGVYPVGGSADLSRVYFTYFGTLVPTDASRARLVEPIEHPGEHPPWSSTVEYGEGEIVEEANGEEFKSCKSENKGHNPSETQGKCRLEAPWENITPKPHLDGPWGFYEWHEGELRSAGELPDGSYSRYGAVPAVTKRNAWGALAFPFARFLLNEVSQDGSTAFFISPEPTQASEAGTPVELYVREQTPGGPKTVLVSRDELEPGSPPAPAPCTKGPFNEACVKTAVTPFKAQKVEDAYVYASPDGSRAFFQSMDKLAKNAAGNEDPQGSGPWTYEFNVKEEKLTYLPGVVEPIAASSQDGSSFIFKNTKTHEIELWSGGAGGHATEIASFSPAEPEFEGTATKDGAVFVFNTNAVLKHPGQEFNNSAGLLQAYRYEVSPSQRLSCVSCAPMGVPQHAVEEGTQPGQGRKIADGGRRVFFATAAKLVPEAEKEVERVYEWEQAGTGSCQSAETEGGCVYLVSSGASPDGSFYLDNDESGENVFFATRAGLVKGDTDASYDVYDARVGGGFPEPPPPVECAGTCRSPEPPPTLSAALTATLGPIENTTRTTVESGTLPQKSEEKSTRAKKLREALKACARKPKRKRAACIKRARRLYGAKATTKRHPRRRRG